MKKLILSKTIMFIFIIGFINCFISLFGTQNTLIGVTVITATLMLLERDLTVSLFKNTTKLLGINILLGILAFLASQNIWIALFINFIALFIVGYLFSYELKKPIYIAFGLQYLFMLSVPVSIEELPIRLISLASGAIFIMIVQLLINKNRLTKISKKIILSICDELEKKIKCIQEKIDDNGHNLNIDKNINKLKKILYDSRKKDFYITNKGMYILNLVMSLERINIILDSYKEDSVDDRDCSLKIISKEIRNLKLYIEKNEEFNQYNTEIKNLNDIKLLELYNTLENIYKCIEEYKEYEQDSKKNLYNEDLEIPNSFKMKSVHKRNFNVESIRFSYALKIALSTAISGFIMEYFKIPEGRWIMYTVFSLIQPYSENCVIKSKKRIQGTLIGGIIIFILFSIVRDKSLRGLIILGAGYISTYTKDYRSLLICNTISAIGSVSIVGNVGLLFVARILCVALGAIVALIINKFIFPYSIEKGYMYLLDMYDKLSREIINEINLSIENKNNSYKFKNLLLVPALIEERIDLINEISENEERKEFIKVKKHLISNMYSLYVNINNNNIQSKDIKNILNETQCIYSTGKYNYEGSKTIIMDRIKSSINVYDKVIYKNLLYILDSINKDKLKNIA